MLKLPNYLNFMKQKLVPTFSDLLEKHEPEQEFVSLAELAGMPREERNEERPDLSRFLIRTHEIKVPHFDFSVRLKGTRKDPPVSCNVHFDIVISIEDLEPYKVGKESYNKTKYEFICKREGSLEELRKWAEVLGIPQFMGLTKKQLCDRIKIHFGFY